MGADENQLREDMETLRSTANKILAELGRSRPGLLVGMSDKAIDLEMTICEAEIDGVPVVIVPEKAQRMLRALGWTPPSGEF